MSLAHATQAWPTRRIVLWGLLWGLFLSAAEFFVIAPLYSTPLIPFLIWWLVIWSLPMWCAVGCGLLLIARRCEPRNDWLALAAGGAALSLAWAWAHASYVGAMQRSAADFDWFAPINFSTGALHTSASNLAVYNLWVSLFYGGLLIAAYVLMARSERLRTLLRDAALARSRTETLLGQTRLQGLQAQVDPQLLLNALDEVRSLYHREPERADALLERLVEFLRAAIPGLTQRRSTLRVEADLAQAYAQLQALLPAGRRWRLELAPRLPELPFPSLLLLPILALPTRQDTPRFALRMKDDKALLTVQGLGREVPTHLAQHAQACLHELFGDAARLRTNESPQTQLAIELDLVPSQTEIRR